MSDLAAGARANACRSAILGACAAHLRRGMLAVAIIAKGIKGIRTIRDYDQRAQSETKRASNGLRAFIRSNIGRTADRSYLWEQDLLQPFAYAAVRTRRAHALRLAARSTPRESDR